MRKLLVMFCVALIAVLLVELVLFGWTFLARNNTSRSSSRVQAQPFQEPKTKPSDIPVDQEKLRMNVTDHEELRYGPDVFQGIVAGGLTIESEQDVRSGVVAYVFRRKVSPTVLNRFRVSVAYGDPNAWARHLEERPMYRNGARVVLYLFGLRTSGGFDELPENYRSILAPLGVGMREKLEAYFLKGTIPPEWQGFVDEQGILDLRPIAAGVYLQG